MELTKHHGLGNDFLVVLDETNRQPVRVDDSLARRLCARRTGIGADGLIHGVAAASETPEAPEVTMVLFNADGTRAEMSGNGIRCLAQALAHARDVPHLEVVVHTDAGPRPCAVRAGAEPETADVRVGMGTAGPGPPVPAAVRDRVGGEVTAVEVGNPHLVVLGRDPQDVDLAVEGRWVERQFPEGINVEYVSLAEPDVLELAVWERGVGITRACGTGATAAAWVTHRAGLVGDSVQVRMPGGTVRVVVGDVLELEGPATYVATVEVPGG